MAFSRSEEEVSRLIRADWLVYQHLDDLIASAQLGNPAIGAFECSVFDGHYITGGIDGDYLARLSRTRNDRSKQWLETDLYGSQAVMDLYENA